MIVARLHSIEGSLLKTLTRQVQRKTNNREVKVALYQRVLIYFSRHWQDIKKASQEIYRHFFQSIFIAVTLGIALLLPLLLYVVLINLHPFSTVLDDEFVIDLYLHEHVTLSAAEALQQKIILQDEILAVDIVNKTEAAELFSAATGLGAIVEDLQENPFPILVKVYLNRDKPELEKVHTLLSSLALVEYISYDEQLQQKVYLGYILIEKIFYILVVLMGLAIILIISGLISAKVIAKKAEIEVSQLVGATNAFIYRPFLYLAVLFGLLGGLVTLFCFAIIWLLLAPTLKPLQLLIASSHHLVLPSASDYLLLLVFPMLLGVISAFFAVNKRLI